MLQHDISPTTTNDNFSQLATSSDIDPLLSTTTTSINDVTKDLSNNHASSSVTILNMLKNVLAAGLVTLPWTFAKTSLKIGIFCNIITCIISNYSAYLLALSIKSLNSKSYLDLIQSSYKSIYLYVQLLLICYTFGTCVSYIILLADIIPNVLHLVVADFYISRSLLILIICYLFLLPLSLNNELKSLKIFSLFGFLCIIYLCLLVTLQWYFDDDDFNLMIVLLLMIIALIIAYQPTGSISLQGHISLQGLLIML